MTPSASRHLPSRRPGRAIALPARRRKFEAALNIALPGRLGQRIAMYWGSPGFRENASRAISEAMKLKSIDEMYRDLLTGPNANPIADEHEYLAQRNRMLQAIGLPMMQMAIPIMQQLTGVFTDVASRRLVRPIGWRRQYLFPNHLRIGPGLRRRY